MLNLPFENLALSLASEQDMPLTEMLQTSSVPLSLAIIPSQEAKLLYCVVLKGKGTELILHMNKEMSNITHYEQHDIYERSFDVFYGNLTVRSQFIQLESELRKKGKSEGRMILYDRKNKPFHAQLKLQPIIIQNDYEELVIAYYLIEMKRLNDEVTSEPIKIIPLPVAMSVEEGSDGSESGKKALSERDSAKTSSQSLSSSSPSDNDDECSSSSKSHRTMGNSDTTSHCDEQSRKRVYTRTTRYDSDQEQRTNKSQSIVRMEIVEPEEERLLTKNALKRHDERSLHEMNSSKRSKFMASK